MAPKPVLAQAEFDEAVKTNIEDFDMAAEEAVASAIEEFELQGYNLDGIIKSASGGNTDSHPVALATWALQDACKDAAAVRLPDLQALVTALQQQLRSSGDVQQAVAVAGKEGSVAALLAAASAAQQLAGDALEIQEQLHAALLPCLRTLRLLMQAPACRSDLLAAGGAETLQQLLRGCCSRLQALQEGTWQQEQLAQQHKLAAAGAALAEAAAWQDEEAKCRFVDMGLAADLLQLLQLLATNSSSSDDSSAAAPLASQPQAAAAAGAAAGALRAFTTADDDRPPASKAFMHSRLLAGQPNNALTVLLPVLRQLQQGAGSRPVGPLMAVLAAVRQIAANDEICKAFGGEAGGVASLQQLLGSATADGPPELVRGVAAALRQLANSDAVKAELAEAGALATLMRAVRAYDSHPPVQEQLLGLLVALVLRMPDIAAAAADAGGVEVLTEVLAAAPAMAAAAKQQKDKAASIGTPAAPAAQPNGSSKQAGGDDEQEKEDEVASRVFGVGGAGGSSNGASAAVQRQACMAVRNMAVRNPELRPAFLAAGAEELLRAVRVLFPGSCRDVGGAALRDLGLDNYN